MCCHAAKLTLQPQCCHCHCHHRCHAAITAAAVMLPCRQSTALLFLLPPSCHHCRRAAATAAKQPSPLLPSCRPGRTSANQALPCCRRSRRCQLPQPLPYCPRCRRRAAAAAKLPPLPPRCCHRRQAAIIATTAKLSPWPHRRHQALPLRRHRRQTARHLNLPPLLPTPQIVVIHPPPHLTARMP